MAKKQNAGISDELQHRIKSEVRRIEYESHAIRILLVAVAAVLCFGVVSLFLPRTLWHYKPIVLVIPPQVLFVTLLVIAALAIYLVRYESEMRKLRLLTLQQAEAAQADHVAKTFDALTNVFTRNFLQSLLEKEIARAERSGRPLALMMCDVNNFKQVNDRYGHLIGDKVLAQIAAILKSCLRGSDHVVRYGGDEFLLILPETAEAGAVTVRERILQRVAEWDFADHISEVQISLSLGLYHHISAQSAEQDLAEVDARLYAEKRLKSPN